MSGAAQHESGYEKIGLTLTDSRSAPQPEPYRRGAPNVVVIVLDDCGFAQLGCYGGPIDTPHIDRLAAEGLRYTNFHTTAVCSPTRACVLTGRNHHRVGMGMLPDIPVPFPGYTGVIPPEAATLPAILREEGWITWSIGKWHLTPTDHRSNAGPFHTWPTGQGFDRAYGFLGGETNQWTPGLFRDQGQVDPPATPEDGYHFTSDIGDEAVGAIRELQLHQPDRPFFLYWASGAPHSPHQVPAEWIDAYEGRFDHGWDVERERTLARQIEMGIVPPGTELSRRPDWVAPWDQLSVDEQRAYARLQEVFAAFLTHTDAQVGRIIDEIDAAGELDNTVFVVVSDNGASGEGGPHGSINHMGQINDVAEDVERLVGEAELAGGHRGYNHYPWGWAFAGNTPLHRWKRYTFEGGVRDPLVLRWPGAADRGGVRNQYCHAIDLLPTLLDLLAVEMPHQVRGVEQMSLDGVSLRPTIDDPGAAEVRTSQYYECWGSRAMYHEGWKVVTDHVNQLNPYERDLMTGSADFRQDRWSLFRPADDFVEAHDLADEHPEKVRELVERWWLEAGRNQVLPIDDAVQDRFPHLHMPYSGMRSRYDLRAGERIFSTAGPMFAGGFTAVAELDGPLGDADGLVCEYGDWIAGWAWAVLGDEVRFLLQVPSVGAFTVSAPRPTGSVLGLSVAVGDDGLAVTHLDGDAEIGSGTVPATMPFVTNTNGEFLTVGYGTPFPVSDDYAPPFRLSSLRRLVVDTEPPAPTRISDIIDDVLRHQ